MFLFLVYDMSLMNDENVSRLKMYYFGAQDRQTTRQHDKIIQYNIIMYYDVTITIFFNSEYLHKSKVRTHV